MEDLRERSNKPEPPPIGASKAQLREFYNVKQGLFDPRHPTADDQDERSN
jgi:hypothetical protein